MQENLLKWTVVTLCFVAMPANAMVDVPANMILTGAISASATVTPSVNDKILVKQKNGKLEGQGTVLSSDGTYAVDLSKTTDFNGTVLTLQFQHGQSIYELTDGSGPIEFPYNGGLFPVRLTLSPTIGKLISGGGAAGGTAGAGATTTATTGTVTPPATQFNANFDVNKDGALDQKDIDQVKQLVANDVPGAAGDVNNDGIVNTRDIIDTIKAVRALNRRGLK